MDATHDVIMREAGFAILLLRAVSTQISASSYRGFWHDLVGSSVLPTHFEPMGFGVISKTFNHFNIANVTST